MTLYGGYLVGEASVSEPVVVGGCFLILCLAVMNTISPGLADTFALLLFIVIFLKYGLKILEAIGVATA
jgi:hypothetical protein